MSTDTVTVRIAGRTLRLSHLDKVLYPSTDFRKRDVLEYYQRVAPVMVAHLSGRPATLVRFPDGVEGGSFFQKDVARYVPDWARSVRLASGAYGGGSEINQHVVFDEQATVLWAANLAALELHVPQWKVDSDGNRCAPDLMVFDLDPGPPATIVECARVAEQLRELLTDQGLRPFAKTSGSKGLQLYCAVRSVVRGDTADFAKSLALHLASEAPDRIVAKMSKALRSGKVLIDWSQNNPAKTTIAPYSLRGRRDPTVSTPIWWSELARCRQPADLVYTAQAVLERLANWGDLFADLHRDPVPVPSAMS